MLRCTSSLLTCAVDWERLPDVGLARLTGPALHDVSFRSLATAAAMTLQVNRRTWFRMKLRNNSLAPRNQTNYIPGSSMPQWRMPLPKQLETSDRKIVARQKTTFQIVKFF